MTTRMIGRIGTLLTLLAAAGCSGASDTVTSVEAAQQLAGTWSDPCMIEASNPPREIANAEAPIRAAFASALRARCSQALGASFVDAVRGGDRAAVDAALAAVVRHATPPGASGPNAATETDANCRNAIVLETARAAYRRAEGAAASQPPRWDDALAALAQVPAVPDELVLLADVEGTGPRVRAAAYADAVDAARRSVAQAQWDAVAPLVDRAHLLEQQLPAESRPTVEELAVVDGYRQRARVCAWVDSASRATTPEEVGDLLRQAVEAADAIPSGQPAPASRERSQLEAARQAAAREAARCDRQAQAHEYCEGRCIDMSDYRSDDWLDRCFEFCDQRAPLCADQQEHRVASGRPASGVVVPSLTMCRPGSR